jgi:hypothetical protein
MNVLVENSTWNNVGDGFYQFSILGLLKNTFPDWDIKMMDGPIKRAFRPSARFESNVFDIIPHYEKVDLYVFSGPILGWKFMDEYAPIIKKIVEQGSRYVIFSTHGKEAERKEIAEFFSKYPPCAFWTRDSVTFDLYKNHVPMPYDGPCAAFLVSKTCDVPYLDYGNYAAVSVYTGYEPSNIEFSLNDKNEIVDSSVRVSAVIKPKHYNIKRHFEWRRKFEKDVNGVKIIRPIQDIGYKFSHLNFARPNSYLSYNPLNYLSIYKSANLTISDRVHSVVPTLSFGNPAVFLGATLRSKLFDRMDLDCQDRKVIRLDSSKLSDEYNCLQQFLISVFN